MNYWINSNTGDYITEKDGEYTLTLKSRYIDGIYYKYEDIKLTVLQFKVIKGFIPIKYKKLFLTSKQPIKYTKTLKGGLKGGQERAKIPTIAEARDQVLKNLGI